MRKKIGLAVFGILVSVVALAWAAKGIEWCKLGYILSGLPIWLPAVAASIYVFSFVPRAVRSHWMLARVGAVPLSLRHAGEAQVMGYAANNLLPLRLGEFVRVFALRQLAGIPGLAGLTSLFAERILDGAVVVLILGGSVAWFVAKGTNFGQTAVEPLLYTGGGLFAIAGLGLIVCALSRRWVTTISERHLSPRLHDALGRIFGALAFLHEPKRAIGVIVLSTLIWLIEGLVFVLIISSLGIQQPCMSGLLMLAIVNLGVLLPSAPGYVGVFQACGILAFQVIGLPREQGLAASLVIHACQFLPITCLGLVLASRHGWSLRSMAHSKPAS